MMRGGECLLEYWERLAIRRNSPRLQEAKGEENSQSGLLRGGVRRRVSPDYYAYRPRKDKAAHQKLMASGRLAHLNLLLRACRCHQMMYHPCNMGKAELADLRFVKNECSTLEHVRANSRTTSTFGGSTDPELLKK